MPFGSEQWMYASGGFYPYEIDQSLRFNDDDSAYLSRTPASAGNRKTWTWSGWVKLGNISNRNTLFATQYTSGNSTTLWIDQNIKVNQVGPSGFQLYLQSDAVLRDASAWYHIVLLMDTTQATTSDRTKIWVNGQEQSLTGVSGSSYPAQNLETHVNELSEPHYLGCEDINILGGVVRFFDGYMAEVNFIDGQALDATDFGEFKSGVWIPKSYSGTYGTNGFYLDFGNSGSLGADSSGNGNNWTPNNLAATDQVLDSPTNNFATLNALINKDNGRGTGTFAEGNLSFTGSDPGTASTINPDSGKYYWEVYLLDGTAGGFLGDFGLSAGYSEIFQGIQGAGIRCLTSSTQTFVNSTAVATASTPAALGDVVSFAWDVDNQLLSVYLRNSIIGSALSVPNDAVLISFLANGGTGDPSTHVANFGQDSSFAGNKTAQGNTDANGIGDFYYAPPSGYLALCTANLPDPVIDPAEDDVPADYFNTVLYQGDNSSPRSVTGVGFQPDFVWLKSRTDVLVHGVADSVRGATKHLYPSLTIAELVNEVDGYLSSFDSDGFTLTAGTSSNATFNRGTDAYVSWNWLAGGSGVTNTDGSITSTVSANQKAGFSIVSYATGGLPSATVGHGLSQPPEIIIAKQRDVDDIWFVLTNKIDGSVDYLVLNTTAAKVDYASGAFTSSTFTNPYALSSDVIAYCFHSVEGFSKIGTYTGNGSTDGTFVYTGFRPAFVMVKQTNGAGSWMTIDSTRDIDNVATQYLHPNLSNAEGSTTLVDILSNGFKWRYTGQSGNASGGTYIYMAFAEMPFKYSNAR